ncbi:MAG: RIP metalloprotease RseP [Desulfuromonadales bacterium C00003068]|jgi:regulator of sigma E protease|nr:MAG: RIP metalloprotease RseP [Desulfuromonadales bacterium C00003068]
MVTVISGILMLGVLVFIHELGHFCVAKLAGVKVLKFSLGFGPRLVSKSWGETEYLICLIPLGGYVQMLGEGVADDESDLSEEDLQRSFSNKSLLRRMAIVAAGPVMNLLLPLLLLPIAYMVGVNIPTFLDESPCVGYVVADSDGQRAGFIAGDCILTVNGAAVSSWTETDKALIPSVGSELQMNVERKGEQLTLALPAENTSLEGLQSLGLLPYQDAVIGTLSPKMPAEMAGLQEGDRIVRINSIHIGSWYELHTVIQELAGDEAQFEIVRDEDHLNVVVAPKFDDGHKMWLVGITPLQHYEMKRYGLVAATKIGFERTFELVELTLVFLQKMVSGHVPANNIGGPIMVMQIAGQAVQTGLSTILTVLSFLSIQLGILNLLPIPILDGGHLFFNFVELLWRKPLSLRAREVLQQVGLGLLLMLMILAFYNDIVRIFFNG